MNPFKLAIKSLIYYRKRNLFLALGIAISTAVLTGAFVVGDSVKYSLNRIVELRLGAVTHTMESGDRYFTLALADTFSRVYETDPAPVLSLDGIAIAGGGKRRINDVQVHGVDKRFDRIAGTDGYYGGLTGDSVVISRNLADRLSIGPGEEFLLRMTRASLVPVNAPFVSDDENTISLRVAIRDVAGVYELGAFSLENSQTAPFNLFISIERLNDLMELGGRANLLLFPGGVENTNELEQQVAGLWDVRDLGLKLQGDPGGKFTEIKSERVFIDDSIANAILEVRPGARPILTYFVNYLAHSGRSTPYSFVSTFTDSDLRKDEIIINEWLADDIDAGFGDTIRLGYYVVGPLRELDPAEKKFVVREVVPMEEPFLDQRLMPDIPGLSDAGNCRDWDTGVPISLDSIRDKDEDYWERYRGTPKAFIAVGQAEEMWENRFGKYTSFRVEEGQDAARALSESIPGRVRPSEIGYRFTPVLERSSFSARNGVDFSELFGGLSFFLLAGAVLLTVLLFRLNIGEREEQLKTLRATGIPARTVQRVLLLEGMIVAISGGIIGIFLSVIYNQLVFIALNSIWRDIVRTDMLEVAIRFPTLLTGLGISLLIAMAAIYFPLRKQVRHLANRACSKHFRKSRMRSKILFTSGITATAIALVLLVIQFLNGKSVDPGIFFVSGGLLLVGGLVLVYGYLERLGSGKSQVNDLVTLGIKNALRNRTRSITVIMMFALGTFLVISTGSNKKDLFVNADERSSGTGGFLYFAESTVPVLQDLSDEAARLDYGLGDGYKVVQMRVAEGDDASCLNLNRIQTPRILGVDPRELSGRFSFVSGTGRDLVGDPWELLEQDLDKNVVPAIADETVIKWSLGMTVGDTLVYQAENGRQIHLVLMAGTAPSIFQGNVLISRDHFLRYFPQNTGTRVFLVDGPVEDSTMISEDLEAGMRDLGWEMEYAAARLAAFNTVTNTYLSIFLVMGALGLLLGTIGLSIVLFRSIIERREELAILRAVGYGKKKIMRMIMTEYLLLLLAGTITGSLAAVIATLPAFMSRNSGASLEMVFVIVLALLLNGVIWIRWITGIGLRTKVLGAAMRNE